MEGRHSRDLGRASSLEAIFPVTRNELERIRQQVCRRAAKVASREAFDQVPVEDGG